MHFLEFADGRETLSLESIRAHCNDPYWHEVFILLFEELSEEVRDVTRGARLLFEGIPSVNGANDPQFDFVYAVKPADGEIAPHQADLVFVSMLVCDPNIRFKSGLR